MFLRQLSLHRTVMRLAEHMNQPLACGCAPPHRPAKYPFDRISQKAYILAMVEVIVTDEFRGWYEDLSQAEQDSVTYAVSQLEEKGVALGFPLSSALEETRYALRELRVQHHGKPYRVIYAFDPKRQAVLIVGGNKAGDGRFYARMIQIAEKVWEEYLRAIS